MDRDRATSGTAELADLRNVLERGQIADVIARGTDLATRLDDPSDRATLHLLVGRAELLNGRLAPAVERFRLASRAADGLRVGIWEAFSRYSAGGLPAVEQVIDEIEAAADGHEITLASVQGIRAWIHLERGQSAAAIELAKSANASALRIGQPDLLGLSWLLLGLAHSTAAEVPEALRAIRAGIDHGIASGHGIALPLLHMNATDLDQWRGQLGSSRHHAHEALNRSEPLTGGLVGVWAHAQLSVTADRCGESDTAIDHLRSAEAALLRGAPLGWAHLAAARLRADRALPVERSALRVLDVWRFIADHGTTGHMNVLALPVCPLLLTLRDEPIRAELVKRLADLEGANPFDRTVIALSRSVSANDVGEAIELAESIERAGEPFVTLAADALALVADLCLANEDRRARTFADAARKIYASIGASGDERRLIERHPLIKGDHDVVLSPAERRVVSLLLEGRTNAEIAAELYLSVKTVETHLARVYRRFGVKSRTQLASQLRSAP
jgi:DNA-binding CsgD family transcriptional regulator/tetratricopeptide (TPR) repeat protein